MTSPAPFRLGIIAARGYPAVHAIRAAVRSLAGRPRPYVVVASDGPAPCCDALAEAAALGIATEPVHEARSGDQDWGWAETRVLQACEAVWIFGLVKGPDLARAEGKPGRAWDRAGDVVETWGVG